MSGVNVFPDGCALPLKFDTNIQAPEELAPPKHGDPQAWVAAPGSVKGAQPKTAGNPSGEIAGMPLTVIGKKKGNKRR
jgi:hypothetical protein